MTLMYLPVQDSKERAKNCERLLYVSRRLLCEIAADTQEIMRTKAYVIGEKSIDISEAMAEAFKVSIAPDVELPEKQHNETFSQTNVQVINETTLMTARRLVKEGKRPLVLNFANGTHVGGGFLTGARAQEETLCYASTLYSTLVGDPMYAYNLQHAEMKSTDYMILSQAVVFRDDSYNLIETPWVMDVVTATAPIAQSRWGGVSKEEGARIMSGRIERLLDVAIAYGYTDLILGAWGCGAFGNDPNRIARLFKVALEKRAGHFETVCFTIADWSEERRFLRPFANVLVSDV